jgi:hypothetical protein
MSVYKKLTEARARLHKMPLKKSGENKFAGYKYFELGDFIPQTMELFQEVGLCGVVSFTLEAATLLIVDVEDGTLIEIKSPWAEASLKGAHAIQNLGAVESYQRRYLWMTAMELTENDAIDASEGADTHKPAPKAAKKEAPVVAEIPKTAPPSIEGREGPWMLKIDSDPGTDIESWIDVLFQATELALEFAKTKSDVMSIFKVNQNIFATLKSLNVEKYDELMAIFKKHKEAKA